MISSSLSLVPIYARLRDVLNLGAVGGELRNGLREPEQAVACKCNASFQKMKTACVTASSKNRVEFGGQAALSDH